MKHTADRKVPPFFVLGFPHGKRLPRHIDVFPLQAKDFTSRIPGVKCRDHDRSQVLGGVPFFGKGIADGLPISKTPVFSFHLCFPATRGENDPIADTSLLAAAVE